MHKEEHLHSSQTISDIVIGMSDGLTVPFALAAGLSGAIDDPTLVVTAGIAEIVAGSIAMGLGGYLAGKTEQDHYDSELKREYQEVEIYPEREKEEIYEALEPYGISEKTASLVVEELIKNKDNWVNFMMKFELGLEKPHHQRAIKSGATIAGAYILGGFIPLIPYTLVDISSEGLKYSALVTIMCLFIFGYFKSKVTGQPVFAGALKVTAIGTVAAAAAYFVAKLIT